ncbi:glycosyltransferase [Methanoculleus frigidifontis]|nr:glycosyltransferase [Methanoculleus sp. FWC-SCC1]
MKLSDLNLRNHIYPLTKIDEVDTILIVRDTIGPSVDKVKYYCPPTWSVKIYPIGLFIKFLYLLYLSLKYKPKLVLGYLLFPHGMLAYIIGKLTRKRVGVNLIAGPVEFFEPGSPIEKYAYTRPLPELSLYGLFVRHIAKRMDIIIVNGTYTKSFLEKIGINKEKIFILYKPMENNFIQTSIPKVIDVLFLGRLAKVKHVETVIHSTYLAKKVIPDIKVAIVGDGPEYTNLVNLSDSLDLSNTIVFYGWKKDPWNWINKSKINLLTSEREGFPQSVMQSLHCGVPVVSSMCGDVTDIIQTGYNGILIRDYNDVESFATSIIWLLQNPDILHDYSNNSIKTVTERITMSAAQDIWMEIIP